MNNSVDQTNFAQTKCIAPLRMLHFIWLGGNGAPPIDAIFVWLFGLSVAVIRFNVSVLLSKSEVLLIVTLQLIENDRINVHLFVCELRKNGKEKE